MELYLLKSGACLAILFVFYKLILENENMHFFKRFYLLGMLVISFGIPLITFTTYVEVLNNTSINITSINLEAQLEETTSFLGYLPTVLWTIYLIGVAFFSFRFIRNLSQILIKINQNQKVKLTDYINVLVLEKVIPHTFFNYIFLNKQKFEANEIPSEVIIHEQTHAKQKHSFDVLIIEFFQIVFWFNPFIYLIKNSIKLNHEFLADQAVLNQGIDSSIYQNILLTFSSNATTPQMANAIYYSSSRLIGNSFKQVKKRFTVMKTHTSAKKIWIRSLLLLPLLAVLIFSFSSRVGVEKNNTTRNEIILQQRASNKELAEYNKLAKKYNTQDKENRIVLKKDLERLEYIYKLMTDKQKANAAPFPDCFPPPPPAPPSPDATKVIKGKNDTKTNIPPPPPAPDEVLPSEDPFKHIVKLAEEGAHFFLFEEGPHFKDGREIDAKKAIEYLRKYENLTVKIRNDYDLYTIVEIRAPGC